MELSIRELTTIINNLDIAILRRNELSIIFNRTDGEMDKIKELQSKLINQRNKLLEEKDKLNGRNLFE